MKINEPLPITAVAYWQQGQDIHCNLRSFNGVCARWRSSQVTVGAEVINQRIHHSHDTVDQWQVTLMFHLM